MRRADTCLRTGLPRRRAGRRACEAGRASRRGRPRGPTLSIRGSDMYLLPPMRDAHFGLMRKVRRGRELEDELLAWRFPALELLEPVADVTAEHDRALVGLHHDDLMPGRVTRRRHEPDARQDLRLAVVHDVRRAGK